MDCRALLLILVLQLQILPSEVYSVSSSSKENDISDTVEEAKESKEKDESKRSGRALNDDFKSQVITSETFIREHLEASNKYRKLHGAVPLDVDYKLVFEAEGYAKQLAEKSDADGKPFLKPSWVYNVGETLFAAYNNSSDSVTGKDVADEWYLGCKSHDWKTNFFSKESSRFSQLIWNDTKSMGIGKAFAPKVGIVIAVARYRPAGNWGYRSSFTANVFPMTGKTEKCEAVAGVPPQKRNFPKDTDNDTTPDIPGPSIPKPDKITPEETTPVPDKITPEETTPIPDNGKPTTDSNITVDINSTSASSSGRFMVKGGTKNNTKVTKDARKGRLVKNNKETQGKEDKENQKKKDKENQRKKDKENQGKKDKENQGKKDKEKQGKKDKENQEKKDKENQGKKDIENQGKNNTESHGKKDKENQGKKDGEKQTKKEKKKQVKKGKEKEAKLSDVKLEKENQPQLDTERKTRSHKETSHKKNVKSTKGEREKPNMKKDKGKSGKNDLGKPLTNDTERPSKLIRKSIQRTNKRRI